MQARTPTCPGLARGRIVSSVASTSKRLKTQGTHHCSTHRRKKYKSNWNNIAKTCTINNKTPSFKHCYFILSSLDTSDYLEFDVVLYTCDMLYSTIIKIAIYRWGLPKSGYQWLCWLWSQVKIDKQAISTLCSVYSYFHATADSHSKQILKSAEMYTPLLRSCYVQL